MQTIAAPFLVFFAFFTEPVAEHAPSAGLSTEHLVVFTNVLIILATLWLTYATLKAAGKERKEIRREAAKENRLIIRLLAGLVKSSDGTHRADS